MIIVAIAGREETLRFSTSLKTKSPSENRKLFYGEGPQIVREIKARGHEVFLDLKLHDISTR